MGLLDLFSKLIVEHGSAEVQGKHIALFKDQLALADKKILELESEVTSHKSQLENATTTIKEFTKENEILRGKIQENEKSSHSDLLDEIRVKILAYLAENEASTADEIACGLTANLQLVRYHLEELNIGNMVTQEHNPMGSNWWSLKQNGRRFLIEAGILA